VKILPIFCAILLVGCSRPGEPPRSAVNPPLPPSLVPAQGALLGAYMDFGDKEDDVTVKKIDRFENLIGKAPAIIASSSYWGEQTFPAANLDLIARHGAVPLIFWSPWDKPYDQDRGPDRFSLTEILAGHWDAYIDAWADGAKKFARPMFVSLSNEMNGSWFPWSGYFYGQGKPVPGQPGKFQGPETCKAAWRHIVDRVRQRGATNIRWVLQLNNYSYPTDEWNELAQYYPGPAYVDWLGLSIYGKQFGTDPWTEPADLVDYPYKEICALDPSKPVMVTEFGIGEFPQSGDKARWLREMFAAIKTRCPRVRAAIYWHERWQNADGTYSNLRVNSSLPALEAFQESAADPFWLGNPKASSGGSPSVLSDR
jgi:hypothetical protein